MKTYITQLHGITDGVRSLSQNIVANVAREIGILPLSLYFYPVNQEKQAELNSRLDGILGAITRDDTVIIQSPTWLGDQYTETLMKKLNLLRLAVGIRLVCFIQEILPLLNDNPVKLSKLINNYNKFDALIVQTPEMLDFLRQNGLNNPRVVVLNSFDFPLALEIDHRQQQINNLNFIDSPYQNSFVSEWNDNQVRLTVFNDRKIDLNNRRQLNYGGKINDDLLPNKLNYQGGWGLIWTDKDQDSKYLSIKAPLAMAAFITAGLPIIVNQKYAAARFIEKHKLGRAVSSLESAKKIASETSVEEYNQIVENVLQQSLLTRNGINIKRALTDAVFKANLPKE